MWVDGRWLSDPAVACCPQGQHPSLRSLRGGFDDLPGSNAIDGTAPPVRSTLPREKQRLVVEAVGKASSIRAQGEAEADIIFKKGEAEAKAMNVKAEAFQEYNQAAVIDKLLTGLPEVVRALSAPLSNVDKITIVSTGNGDSAGMNKITGDITQMAAQVPALFETLSGMKMSELLGKVRTICDKAPKPDLPGDDKGKGAGAGN